MQFADVACALKTQTAIITAFQIQGTGTRYRFPAGTAVMIAVCVFNAKQHPQTAYRKYAVLIGTIFENYGKKQKRSSCRIV
jgi:hypothetical protein